MAKVKQRRVTVADILNQCTGVMKVDEEGNYAGYYTRGELERELLAQGHSKEYVGMYMIGIKECTEVHPDSN